jgi:hydrogenase maturation protein HypF
MKLERLLERGRDSVPIPISRQGNVIRTAEMFRVMVEAKASPEDKAHSMVKAVMRGLVDMAVESAQSQGVRSVGISGGVTYNRAISSMAKELVEERGLKFTCHDRLPNGDGCIAVGQCAIALKRMK